MTYHGYTLVIGTYGKQGSRHLYRCSLDGQTGQLSDLTTLAEAQQASALSQTHTGQLLYLLKTTDGAGLACLSNQDQSTSHAVTETIPACHLTYSRSQEQAYTANYHTGEVLAYLVEPTGQLQLAHRLALGQGSQPHFVGETTDNLVVISLMGRDCLVTYDKDWKRLNQYDLPLGTGPRHLVFHPTYKTVYMVGERDNQVHVLFYDGRGAFEHYQTHSTLPENCQTESWAGAIRLSPCGNFLYVSNRGHDSITIFQVAPDGGLVLVEWLALPGKNPRDLVLTPQGDLLLVACLDSDLVLSFAIDPKTGTLSPRSQLSVLEPVALLVQVT